MKKDREEKVKFSNILPNNQTTTAPNFNKFGEGWWHNQKFALI